MTQVKTKWLLVVVVLACLCLVFLPTQLATGQQQTIKFFTDFPNSTPQDSDFFVLQRNNNFINSTPAQVRTTWFNNPQFTGNGNITGAFGINGFELLLGYLDVRGIIYGNGAGITNLGSFSFLLKTNDIGVTETFINSTNSGITTFTGLGDGIFLGSGTYLFGNLTSSVAAWQADGTLSNVVIGANLQLSGNVLSASATNTALASTNSITVNTNVFISTSNAYINNVTETNVVFVVQKGGTIIVTNVSIAAPGGLTNLNLTANSAIKSDANDVETSIPNIHGVLTNTASGPPSFGLLQNTEMQNSTIGINGTANQITSSSSTPALGGSTTLAIANPLLAPGPISTSGFTNSNDAASQFKITDSGKGEQTTLNGGTLTNLNGQSLTGLVNTVYWDASAYMTNASFNSNNLAYVTGGAASGSLQGSGYYLLYPLSSVQGGTNQWLTQIVLPPSWNSNAVVLSSDFFFATNSSLASNITVSASISWNGSAYSSPITVTSTIPISTGFTSTNVELGPFPVSGTATPNESLSIQWQYWGVTTGRFTNAAWGSRSGIVFTNSAVQNALVTQW